MPVNYDTTLGLSTILEEVINLHRIVIKEVVKINSPRVFFNLGHKLKPVELAGGESTLTITLMEDSEALPLRNQMTFQFLPTVDALDSLDLHPQRLYKDTSNAYRLASKSNLHGDRLTAADVQLFEIFQDWVHPNTDTHLNGVIEYDGK